MSLAGRVAGRDHARLREHEREIGPGDAELVRERRQLGVGRARRVEPGSHRCDARPVDAT